MNGITVADIQQLLDDKISDQQSLVFDLSDLLKNIERIME